MSLLALSLRRQSSTSSNPQLPVPALSFERLEPRTLLAAADITSLVLQVNDQEVVVDTNNSVVQLSVGDRVQVSGINYQVQEGLEGAFAAEGYLRQVAPGSEPGNFDYGDGRFGDPDTQDPIAPGAYSHSGLEGAWKVQQGSDRMSVALVRYADAAVVESRFFVFLQVEQPDFLVTERTATQLAGSSVVMKGELHNAGSGLYHTYAEVNVFHATDLVNPVWVGTLSANLGPGESAAGEFLNHNDDDAFSKRWTPQDPSEYVIVFVADPERVWDESNEDNNWLVRRLTVTQQDLIQVVITSLTSIVESDPGSTGKLKIPIRRLEGALHQLDKNPAHDHVAIRQIEKAVRDLERAVKDDVLDPLQGTQLMNQLAGVARSMAVDALNQRTFEGADSEKLAEVRTAIEKGDRHRASGEFRDAVGQYRDALSGSKKLPRLLDLIDSMFADTAGAEKLSLATLREAVDEGIDFWRASGLDAPSLSALYEQLVDLFGSPLGTAYADRIAKELDAAGYDWSTELDSALGGEDRRWVVAQELAHVLGFDDHDDGEHGAKEARYMDLALWRR